ncbi:phosphoribosylaminoimidazolesuccinocarboxamide synthase [Vulcanibacillus modesticaldus]|uniref:Phosphoribosylaminoimidazole-succinocarboxamide synthase n=1 Tax=Vulcanibacillus modesticaldus TaxID=337097 RepID=A0A1D2YUV5_9BACI|nr:phosphoribosylaminoimidazolesuccinocarboxamide synthase [Vulcanibacillus modesticaldus]OEF99479.1 phosphoribosylaminoimidazolesuccinocarboxamide synthase [Vulcanibacillus modesticaldus]
MEILGLLYEGKAKKIYSTDQEEQLLVEYKDDATAFNGEKRDVISGKGELNNRISGIFFRLLTENGVENHYLKEISPTKQLVKKVEIVPIEVVIRNIVAGSLAKRLGLAEGTILPQPVVEFYYKNDQLGDPLINSSHIAVLQLATKEQVQKMKAISLKVNEIITAFLRERKIILVDFKLEFGITGDGQLILADEISPDTCRFWDEETYEKLDKDRFRRDLGNVEEAYRKILNRIGGEENV